MMGGGRTMSQVKFMSPEEIMKKNREIMVGDLLRQVRELTKYLHDTINSLVEKKPTRIQRKTLIAEISDDSSSLTGKSDNRPNFRGKNAVGGFASRILGNFQSNQKAKDSSDNSSTPQNGVRASADSGGTSFSNGSISPAGGGFAKAPATIEAQIIERLRKEKDLAELN